MKYGLRQTYLTGWKWVYKLKLDTEENIFIYKAHLVKDTIKDTKLIITKSSHSPETNQFLQYFQLLEELS